MPDQTGAPARTGRSTPREDGWVRPPPFAPVRPRRSLRRGSGWWRRRRLPLTVAPATLAAVVAAVVIVLRLNQDTVAGHPSAEQPAPPYPVGACLFESDDQQGDPVLHGTHCGAEDATLVIDAVVPDAAGCAGIADFARYGLVQYDHDAGVMYCLALAVPEQGCFLIGQHEAPHRVDCGSIAGAKRIAAIDPGSPISACTAVPAVSDVWYDRSPTSGRFACLVPDG